MKKKYLTHRKRGGFQVPENYFEEFESCFFAKLEIENSVSARLFEKESTASGFEVPQNYFQTFEAKLPSSAPKVVSLFRKKKWMYAASIAAMFVLVFSIFNQKTTSSSFSTIGYDSIENYIENDNIDFSHSEMESFLSEGSDLSELEFGTIDENALFDYLMNNSRELSFINQ